MNKTCLIDGCLEEIPVEKQMCADHWRCVPGQLKMKIEKAFKEEDWEYFACVTDWANRHVLAVFREAED